MSDKRAQIFKAKQAERYKCLMEKAKEYSLLIVELTPESREQSLALTQLEIVTFWLNAALTGHKEGAEE